MPKPRFEDLSSDDQAKLLGVWERYCFAVAALHLEDGSADQAPSFERGDWMPFWYSPVHGNGDPEGNEVQKALAAANGAAVSLWDVMDDVRERYGLERSYHVYGLLQARVSWQATVEAVRDDPSLLVGS